MDVRAREINDAKPEYVLDQIIPRAERFKEPRIAVLGLAFKPDIDDLRDAEEKMRLTRSAALQGGAGALSRDMKAVRLLLREFADALELLEKTWAGSSGRQSRRTWTKAFLAEFKESDKKRNALFQRLDALRRHIDRFQSARIQLA